MEEQKQGEQLQDQKNIENINIEDIKYVNYTSQDQLEIMMKMIETELSEPYSIYTYRHFLDSWAHLCFLAYYNEKMIGVIIGKIEQKQNRQRGYIAMIVVLKQYRRLKIGKKLVQLFIDAVQKCGGDEVVLETEYVNKAALALYESLGFARDKRLMNYYMNGNDAFRLKLWLTSEAEIEKKIQQKQEQQQQQQQIQDVEKNIEQVKIDDSATNNNQVNR